MIRIRPAVVIFALSLLGSGHSRGSESLDDLHFKADLITNRGQLYLTGDDVEFFVRVRYDSHLVLDAVVTATLTDAPEPRRSGALFVDGTDLLHDPNGDANYDNRFVPWGKGIYNWTFNVRSPQYQPGGIQLRRTILVSVSVDPKSTKVVTTPLPAHSSGLKAVRVAITPQDAWGELLGPKEDHAVHWSLRGGLFEHAFQETKAPTFTDGTYQRVILYREDQQPVLNVSASGTVLPEIDIRN